MTAVGGLPSAVQTLVRGSPKSAPGAGDPPSGLSSFLTDLRKTCLIFMGDFLFFFDLFLLSQALLDA